MCSIFEGSNLLSFLYEAVMDIEFGKMGLSLTASHWNESKFDCQKPRETKHMHGCRVQNKVVYLKMAIRLKRACVCNEEEEEEEDLRRWKKNI
jgi:hypothetical protein